MTKYIVGNEGGIFLLQRNEFTTSVDNATKFDKIGDAMRECVRLNDIKFGFASLFRVIPIW